MVCVVNVSVVINLSGGHGGEDGGEAVGDIASLLRIG